jgi:hypothetical protein
MGRARQICRCGDLVRNGRRRCQESTRKSKVHLIEYLKQIKSHFGVSILIKCDFEFNARAFILSESSLFVFESRIIVKTCGTTRCLKALEYSIQLAAKSCGLSKIQARAAKIRFVGLLNNQIGDEKQSREGRTVFFFHFKVLVASNACSFNFDLL